MTRQCWLRLPGETHPIKSEMVGDWEDDVPADPYEPHPDQMELC